SILSVLVGRQVRTIDGAWERTYSVRNVRSLAPCSIEVQDVTRLSAPNNPSLWSVEEDTQSFSLNGVRATLASVGAVGRVTIKSDTPTIRLYRTVSTRNLSDDARLT